MGPSAHCLSWPATNGVCVLILRSWSAAAMMGDSLSVGIWQIGVSQSVTHDNIQKSEGGWKEWQVVVIIGRILYLQYYI